MENVYFIGGGIVLVGLAISLFFIFKVKRKHEAIKHYEELRDKLSVREAEEQTGITEEDYNSGSGLSIIPGIIGGLVTLLVGFSLLPTISEQLNLAQNSSNVTGMSDTILGVFPIVFAVTVGLMAIGMVLNSLRDSGLI